MNYREFDNRQAKLTSVDYLLSVLFRLDLVDQRNALRVFRIYKSKIFRY